MLSRLISHRNSAFLLPLRAFCFSASSKEIESPKDIEIPREKVKLNFSRSSGPGGQNVNKVNTKVELRFNVDAADWLSEEVKAKLKEMQRNSINSEGELIVTSQVGRTQERNREDAFEKLRLAVFLASLTEKERKYDIPPETEDMARRRVDWKRKKSEVKRTRQGKFDQGREEFWGA